MVRSARVNEGDSNTPFCRPTHECGAIVLPSPKECGSLSCELSNGLLSNVKCIWSTGELTQSFRIEHLVSGSNTVDV